MHKAWFFYEANRHRGKGQQKVTVEHVHIHRGGQAIVGSVSGVGGGLLTKPEEQPQAKGKSDTSGGALSMGDASMPALRGVDPARDLVPVSRDG